MKRENFESLCQAAEEGRDSFVGHPSSNEEGLLTSCIIETGVMLVKSQDQEPHAWNYRECEDLEYLEEKSISSH